MGRTITILGMGPSSNERRHDIESYCTGEVWGLNNGYLTFPQLRGKWGRFFELHSWAYLQQWKSGARCHYSELEQLGCPVYVGQPLPVVTTQNVYPFVDVCTHFDCNYFLGSPSLMLMLALYEHDRGETIEEIRSWGIDTSDPTHAQQRTSWAFWLSKAHERGIVTSGTAKHFFEEEEVDAGLKGLCEMIGDEMMRRKESAKDQGV